MALTVLNKTTDNNKGSIMRPIGSESYFEIQASSTLAGHVIYVVPYMFVQGTSNIGKLFADNQPPTIGWSVAYPGSNGTVDMVKTQHAYDYAHINTGIKLTRTNTTKFTILPRFIMTADLLGGDGTYNVDNQTRVKCPTRIQGVPFQYGATSVYTEPRVARYLVVTYNTSTQKVVDWVAVDLGYQARFYNKGLAGGAPEFTKFDYFFTQGGDVVDGVSVVTDTDITFRITGSYAGAWVYVFEDSGNGNNKPFIPDLNLSGLWCTNDGTTSAIPDVGSAAIKSNNAATNSGSDWLHRVTLNKTYFKKGKTYRIIFVPTKANDYSNSYYTNVVKVVDVNPLISGTISDEIRQYDTTNTIYTDGVHNACVGERIRFTALMDKASYNAAASALFAGTFDINFGHYKIYVTEQNIADGQALDYSKATLVTSIGIANNTTSCGGTTTLRMQDSWLNRTIYVTHEWVFNMKYLLFDYQDVVYYQQPVTVRADATDTQFEALELLTDASDDVSGEDTLCDGETTTLTAHVKNKLLAGYDLITIVTEENNKWTNNAFVRLQDKAILSSNASVASSATAEVVIDYSLLEADKEYRLEVIAIPQVAGTKATCSGTTCDIDVTYTGDITGTGMGYLAVIYDVDAGSPVSKVQLTLIQQSVSDNGKPILGGNFESVFTSEQQTDTFSLLPFTNATQTKTVTVKMSVITIGGCQYNGSKTVTVEKGNTVSDTITLS